MTARKVAAAVLAGPTVAVTAVWLQDHPTARTLLAIILTGLVGVWYGHRTARR